MYPRTAGERPGRPRYRPAHAGKRVWTRCEPARARSRAGCGNLRSGSMGSILSNRRDSGCVTRNDPISASRTASRFGSCQPFSDLLGPLLTVDFINKYGISWDFLLGGIGSGGRRSIHAELRLGGSSKLRSSTAIALAGTTRQMFGHLAHMAVAGVSREFIDSHRPASRAVNRRALRDVALRRLAPPAAPNCHKPRSGLTRGHHVRGTRRIMGCVSSNARTAAEPFPTLWGLRLQGDSSMNTGMECGENVKARATTRFHWCTLPVTRDAAEAALLPSRSRKPGTGTGHRLAFQTGQGTKGKVCWLRRAATVQAPSPDSRRPSLGAASRYSPDAAVSRRALSRVNAVVPARRLTRAAAEARMRRGRWSRGRATS